MSKQQIATFRKIAKDNYDKSMGWSTFVECFGDEEIAEFFEGFDAEEADEIESAMAELVSIWDDRHADAKQYRDDATEDERNEWENDQFDLEREGV
jgi:hypothetical protein